ncbi:uncharacterized protein CTRU02_206726 [Colletotrichum truncatum]|uniref:Uncharacterized protein n=1 Tax=Colletotrichum truncatum TaxID=5467 RepID=A0ACC3Z7Q4_COLTU|nr:uncharacterized protein CTRU02_14148 [Colletotrichum truncatum]KAF6782501.1 hypothetical protein CTRU02_14148 [Colletotrichum truncatum]
MLSTISNRCGCPTPVPTVTVKYPCDGPIPGGCQLTEYIYATETHKCGGLSLTTRIIPTIPPIPTFTACPTVYKTKTICSTCVRPMCLARSTISSMCHCPRRVPTRVVGWPCGGPCPGGCGGTEYIYATNKPTCTRRLLEPVVTKA